MKNIFITAILLLGLIYQTTAISGETIAEIQNVHNQFAIAQDIMFFLPTLSERVDYMGSHVSHLITNDVILISGVEGFPFILRGKTNVTNLYKSLVSNHIITWSNQNSGSFFACKLHQCVSPYCYGEYYLALTATPSLYKTNGYNVENDTSRYNVVNWSYAYTIFRKMPANHPVEYLIYVKTFGGGIWHYIDENIGDNPRVSSWKSHYWVNPDNCTIGDTLLNLINPV